MKLVPRWFKVLNVYKTEIVGLPIFKILPIYDYLSSESFVTYILCYSFST